MASGKKRNAKNASSSEKKAPAKKRSSLQKIEGVFWLGLVVSITFIFLAVMLLLSFFFKTDFLRFFKETAMGFTGPGWVLTPFSLLALAWSILIVEKQNKHIGQILSFLLLPPTVGAAWHFFASGRGFYPPDLSLLFQEGKTLVSGGVLGSVCVEYVSHWISTAGAVLVWFCVFAVQVIWVTRHNLFTLLMEVRNRLREHSHDYYTHSDAKKAMLAEDRAARREDAREVNRQRKEEHLEAERERRKDSLAEKRRLREEEKSEAGYRAASAARTASAAASAADASSTDADAKPASSPSAARSVPPEVNLTEPSSQPSPPEDPSSMENLVAGLGRKTIRLGQPKGLFSFPSNKKSKGKEGEVPLETEKIRTEDLADEYPDPSSPEDREPSVNPATGEIYDASTSPSSENIPEEIPVEDSFPPASAENEEPEEEYPFAEDSEESTSQDRASGEDFSDLPPVQTAPDDRMLRENGIDPATLAEDEKPRPSMLRPGAEEKARLEASLATHAQPEYVLPSFQLLKCGSAASPASAEELRSGTETLTKTLNSFNIEAKVTDIIRGPSITRYELRLGEGVRLAKLQNLSDDIALALAAQSVRISAIPDKSSIGIEVPNQQVSTVTLRECLESPEFSKSKGNVTFALGKDITGHVIVWDIAKLPHLLVAGTTGSGKSVCINSILISLLYRAKPDEVKFIMIDPKIVELGVYNGIPHLMTPVVTDPKKAAGTLQWGVFEMLRRYQQMADMGVRSLFDYNNEVERRWKQPEEDGDEDRRKLPQVVIVIDELADLMISSPKEVDEAIQRIAQMGRAAGIHLIVATQRPSADVITGLMKANIPSRIGFAVSSGMESRIILDAPGAEKLIGRGDMLFSPMSASKPLRVQGCYISDEEIAAVCRYVKSFGSAEYDQATQAEIQRAAENVQNKGKGLNTTYSVEEGDEEDSTYGDDPLLEDAISFVIDSGSASTSALQRRMRLGYTRAARLIDMMEERGIVGPLQGSKGREIMISSSDWEEMKATGNWK